MMSPIAAVTVSVAQRKGRDFGKVPQDSRALGARTERRITDPSRTFQAILALHVGSEDLLCSGPLQEAGLTHGPLIGRHAATRTRRVSTRIDASLASAGPHRR